MKRILFQWLVIVTITSTVFSAHAEGNGAQKFIENIGNKAISIISKNNNTDIQKEQQLISLFKETVDIRWISRFVLGKHWKEMDNNAKEKYTSLYQQYLVNSYVPKFRDYTDQKLIIKLTEKMRENEFNVKTEIQSGSGNGEKLSIDYRVRKNRNGDYQVFDIIAEGVSLIITQRSEFNAIISRSSVNDLIVKLEEKIVAAK